MALVLPPDTSNGLVAAGPTDFVLINLEHLSTFGMPYPNGSADLAAQFDTYSSNSNYTVWYFKVKPGLKWSDGENATANDILSTFGPNFALNATYDFPNVAPMIKTEYAANSTTAVFVLNSPNAHFPEVISGFYFTMIYPASYIAKEGPAGLYFNAPADGPFYVAQFTQGGSEMVLMRNPYFSPLPKICEIDVSFVESSSQIPSLLKSGQVDLAPVDPSDVQALQQLPYIHIYQNPAHSFDGLQYNITSYPYNMTQFRQALAYSINYTAVVSNGYSGLAIPANNAQGEEPPSVTSWYNPNQVTYSYNTTKALLLLKSIGLTKGTDGYLHYANGTKVSLTLWTDTKMPSDLLTSEILQKDFQALGMTINLVTTSISSEIGDYSSNIDGAQTAMHFYTQNGITMQDPWLMSQPGWDTTWAMALAPPPKYWVYPAHAQTAYQSNLTALSSTDNTTLMRQYDYNIQALNAKYLPMIVTSYSSYPWAANTNAFGNWPSGYIIYGGNYLNQTALATIAPKTTSSVSTSSSSSSTSTSGLPSQTLLLAAVAVVVVVLVIGSVVVVSRKRSTKPA